jgi:hypothetical protein
MRALAGELLLEAFDQGRAEHDLQRALTLLSLALPESGRRELAEASIAERNLQLLRLREISFGPLLTGFAACAHCGARLEFSLPVAPLRASLEHLLPEGPAEWVEEGRGYQMRPANTVDLLASLQVAAEEAPDYLLARCLDNSEVPATARQRFEQLNAAAELWCEITCPGCARGDSLDLDIAHFLWAEIRHAAQRLLREVHELAGAYGWSEESIVRMSGPRRAAYLEMVGT